MKGNDHRVRVTKMLIRRAFTELLRQKPIQSISVKELCAAAGINRGTFYAHYTDLYDLLRQMEEEMMADVGKALRETVRAEGDDSIPMRITEGLFQCLKDNADLCTVTLGPYGDKGFAARLLNIGREYYVEAYRRYFTQATPKQLEYYYAFVSAGCMGLLEKWLADGMTSSAREIAAMAQSIMVSGVGFFQTKT